MFLEERQENIMTLLERDGKVAVRDLSKRYGVTEDCIRKDLSNLEKQGRLKRTYGGAVMLREKLYAMEAEARRSADISAKRKIAAVANRLINDNDMVFLDISTSNLALAELLVKEERELTVVTNMIDVLVILSRSPKINLIFTGGTINRSRDGFWDVMTMDFISHLKPDIAFIGAVGVDVCANSVSTYDIEDGINKAAIVRAAKKAYVVAEAKKLSNAGSYNYVTLDALSGLITDSRPAENICRAAREYGVRIILPEG